MIERVVLAVALWGGLSVLAAAVLSVLAKEIKGRRLRRFYREQEAKRRMGGEP